MLTMSMSPRRSPRAPRSGRGPAAPPGAAALLSVLLLCPPLSLAGCSGDKVESTPATKRPAVPVGVAAVEQKTIPLQIQAIGTVEASAVVSIKAQVGGELLRVHIKEGQDVKKGDLLFSIDPRVYEAALAQAEANLARDRGQIQQARAVLERDQSRIGQARAGLLRDQAQAKNAKVQEKRYADLLGRGMIAQEQYDGIRTNSESLAATVGADEADVKSAEDTVRADEAAIKAAEQTARADEAVVDNAKLQLGYTSIRSPVDGRTGSLMLHEGNVVRVGGTGDSTLLVINQVQPIYVSFTVPQQQLPAINRYMAEGKLQVDALPAGEAKPVAGRRDVHGQCGGPDDGDDSPQGHLRERGEEALARAVRERRAHARHRGRRARGAVPGGADRPAGDLRLRREARCHRREPARGGRPHPGEREHHRQGPREGRERRRRRPDPARGRRQGRGPRRRAPRRRRTPARPLRAAARGTRERTTRSADESP